MLPKVSKSIINTKNYFIERAARAKRVKTHNMHPIEMLDYKILKSLNIIRQMIFAIH